MLVVQRGSPEIYHPQFRALRNPLPLRVKIKCLFFKQNILRFEISMSVSYFMQEAHTAQDLFKVVLDHFDVNSFEIVDFEELIE